MSDNQNTIDDLAFDAFVEIGRKMRFWSNFAPPRPSPFQVYLPPAPGANIVMLHLGRRLSFDYYPYSFIVKADYEPLSRNWKIVNPILYHAVWDQVYDRYDVRDLKNLRTTPTVRIRQTEPDQRFNELIQEGREIKVPFIGTHFPDGYDGSRTWLYVFMTESLVDLEWWSRGPEGWQPLNEWTWKLEDYFVELLKDQPIVGEDTRTNPVAMWHCLLETCGRNWNLGTKMRFEYEKRSVKEMMPSVEAALSVPLPEYQRQIISCQTFSDEMSHIRLSAKDGTFFLHLHTPEKILELREDATIPRTIHDTPVIPFASDERGVLLLELTDAGAVWRWHDGNVQQVADTLAKYFIDLLHKWQRIYGYSAW